MKKANPERRLPGFLVIGAMKCGTTTLYHDLRSHPSIFLPDKEGNFLFAAYPGPVYAAACAPAREGLLLGDVSPDYAKLPESAAAVPAARALFSRSPKLLYLVRDPIRRLLSHHHFVLTRRDGSGPAIPPTIDRAAREFPALLNYSRYATQLRPWIDAFGREAVKVIRFEDYVADRAAALAEIGEFLGLARPFPDAGLATVHNPSAGRPVLTPFWSRVRQSAAYRRFVRPLTTPEMRDRLRRLLLPKSGGNPARPGRRTLEFLIAELGPEVAALADLTGSDSPFWDLEETARRILDA